MIRVAEYLNGTQDLGLVIRASDMIMVAAADAAYGVHADRKSHSGWALRYGEKNAPFDASSKKQALVTDSSTAAELVALQAVAKEVLWMRGVLDEMGYHQAEPTKIEQDNKACILIASRGRKRDVNLSKAVDIKYFWISDKIEEGEIELKWIDTEDLIADGLTKPLVGAKFKKWRDRILNITTEDPVTSKRQLEGEVSNSIAEQQPVASGNNSKKRRKVDPSAQ